MPENHEPARSERCSTRRKYLRIVNNFSNWRYPPNISLSLLQYHVDGNVVYVFVTPNQNPGVVTVAESAVKVRFLTTFDKLFESVAGGQSSKFNLVVNAGMWYVTSLMPNLLFIAKSSSDGTLRMQISTVCCFALWGLILLFFFTIKSLGGDVIAETSPENEQLWLEALQHDMYRKKDPQREHFRSFQFKLLTRARQKKIEENEQKNGPKKRSIEERKKAEIAKLWNDFLIEIEEKIMVYELAYEIEQLVSSKEEKRHRVRSRDPNAVTPISCAENFLKGKRVKISERHVTVFSGRNISVIQRLWMIRMKKEPYKSISDLLDDEEYPSDSEEDAPSDVVTVELDDASNDDSESSDSEIEGLTKPKEETDEVNLETLPLLRLRVLPSLIQFPKMSRAIDFNYTNYESANAITDSPKFKSSFRRICCSRETDLPSEADLPSVTDLPN